MRILLIIPTFLYKYKNRYPAFMSNSDFPVGFAYLASALRNAGHEVFGLNPNNDTNYGSQYEMLYNRVRNRLKETQPELIGLGGLCTDFEFLKDAMQIIRTLEPNIPIVCGGGIINNDAGFIFQILRPDFCIVGEGEEALVQLAGMLEGGSKNYIQIPNLGYWEEGIPKFTRQNFDYIDIDKGYFPDYEPFEIEEMLDNFSLAARYLYRYTRTNPRPMTIVTARGCPFNCTFCVHQKGPKYRARSVEKIIQEIAFLYERYHFNILIILDELFAVNRLRMKEFCIALIETRNNLGWDFDWSFQTHASASLSQDDLDLAREAGCYCFSYGLESASPKVLLNMNKKTKPSQIVEAIKIANSANLGFSGNFIFGDITETAETISESMDFFSKYCLDNHIYLAHVQPYPGSKLFDDCIKRGIIRDRLEFYEHIDEGIFNMTSMPDALWITWIEKAESLSFSWAKSINAVFCAQEFEAAENPMVLNSGKSVWKIKAHCPHCGKEIYFRELLENIKEKKEPAKEKRANLIFVIFRSLIFKIVSIYQRNKRANRSFFYNFCTFIFKLFKRIIVKAVSFFVIYYHPLFKLLKPLRKRGDIAPISFITGCPNCNRRFRVNVPVMDLGSFTKNDKKISLEDKSFSLSKNDFETVSLAKECIK